MHIDELPVWALQITGPKTDIADAKLIFGAASDPSIISFTETGGDEITLLISPQFEALNVAQEVNDIAQRLLGVVNGLLFVVEPGRTPLVGGGIRKRSPSGLWGYHLIAASGLIIARGRARGVGVAIVGGVASPEHMRPPAYVRWAAAAQSDQVVADVMIYLSGDPDWFDYYKAFELMRDDINRRLGQHQEHTMGWPPKKDVDHFKLSAQVYRHAPPWDGGYSPAKALSLGQSARFIHLLADKWLTWRFP